jgi:hypothetical protein
MCNLIRYSEDAYVRWITPPWVPQSVVRGWDPPGRDNDDLRFILRYVPSYYFRDLHEAMNKILVQDAYLYNSSSLKSELDPESLFLEWASDSPHDAPPNPLIETRKMFLARMQQAWSDRVATLQTAKPAKRKIAAHARWFVRFQASGESIQEIWDHCSKDEDLSTIRKALKTFSALIELPLRDV